MKRFRIQAVAVAGFLFLASLASPSSSAAATQEKGASQQPSTKQKQEKQIRGARDMADEQIKTVTCKGRAMDMTFDASDEVLQLHTDNYFKVNFSAINFTPSGTMNPCKTVQGMYARVHYYDIKGRSKEGELISVELRK